MLFPVFVIESKLLFTDKVSILINNKKRWRRNMPKGKTTVFFCQECGYESSRRQCSGISGRGEERSALTDRDDTGQTHVDGYERA